MQRPCRTKRLPWETASAIAKDLGILEKGNAAVTGAEPDAMTDPELDTQVEHISVYARVSPENKIRIVKAWQRKEQIVSMTGDGVNDASALKAADMIPLSGTLYGIGLILVLIPLPVIELSKTFGLIKHHG